MDFNYLRYHYCVIIRVAINLTKNPIQHSRIKHIKIRHHFIRDHTNNGDYEIKFIQTANQSINLFTKPLAKERLNFLITKLDILDYSSIP